MNNVNFNGLIKTICVCFCTNAYLNYFLAREDTTYFGVSVNQKKEVLLNPFVYSIFLFYLFKKDQESDRDETRYVP